AAAAPDDWRAADGSRLRPPAKPSQRVSPHVQKVGDAGGAQRLRVNEYTVFGHELQTLQQPMQSQSGLAGPACAHEQHCPSGVRNAGGMQRDEALHASREREDRKLDELVARVIRE